MMRNAALGMIVATVCFAGMLRAQDLSVLPDEKKMLHTYLIGECKTQFEARRQAVAALKTSDDVRKRQETLRTAFIQALGGFPEKTPLKAKVVGAENGEGFRVEKVIYESRPEHHVTANLYLPEGKGPFPGVLMPCGHSTNGKASEAYQRICISLAKNGIAALSYDPIGQGERIQLLDKQGKPAIAGSTSEHTMVGVGALLVGESTASYRIWDGIRSLDYLASRPEIDPKRLGCTGNSGGGTLTSYLMALDDRIAVAAPSCYITSLERLFDTIGPQDAEQNITGQVAFGMEHADFITLRTPRPTLICTGTQDFFDIQGSWTTFREAKQIYSIMGHSERIDLIEYNDKHGFSKPRREAVVRWMRRWLLNKDDAVVEEAFPVFKDEQLQCTRTGQVIEDLKGVSAFDLTALREQKLRTRREEFTTSNDRAQTLEQIRRLIGLPEAFPAANVKQVGESGKRGDITIVKQVYEIENGIKVPALRFTPAKATQPTVVYLHGDGKEAAAKSDALDKLLNAGHPVIALDLRGWGETAPGKPAVNKPNFFGVDFKEIFLAIHLNRPLLGQRVRDVLAVVKTVTREKDTPFVHLVGVQTAGPVALHAAVLEPGIRAVTLEHSLVSWSAAARTPISHNQLTNVVPGVLNSYDLPDLAALIAPRSLTLVDTVDPTGTSIGVEETEKVYARCRDSYKKAKAEKSLQVK